MRWGEGEGGVREYPPFWSARPRVVWCRGEGGGRRRESSHREEEKERESAAASARGEGPQL